MRAVQPIAHELFPGHAFALRDLRFVVRKNVVHAAAMNVDLIAEQRGRHRAALDVPARPARAPWTFPANFAVLFIPRFPEREIADVLLVVLIVPDASGWLQLSEIEMGELAVIGKLVDPKINGFVVRLVSEAAGHP